MGGSFEVMARKQKKAQSMLNRFLQGKKEEKAQPKQKRPYLATEVNDLQEAEKWRYDVVKNIAKKVGEVQNRGLGEYKIRDLNDEINKLIRVKGHWERRILELGGPNYRSLSRPRDLQEDTTKNIDKGYRYFGAARSLPGVKELFDKQAPKVVKKTRYQL